MLGGGSFTTQNKVLPGAYLNFVSAATTRSLLSERGIAAVPVILDWGPEKEVFEVTAESFQNHCFELFGHSYEDEEMKPFRELFRNLNKGIFFRLNGGIRAANDYAVARYSGRRGSSMTMVISRNINDSSMYDVKTLLAGKEVDRQTVASMADLQDSDYCTFKRETVLRETAGIPFTGGTNGDEVTGADYAAFLAAMEAYSFHTLCCPSTNDSVKALFAAYTRRLRDEAGIKFQTVMYRFPQADYEGVISVENSVRGSAMAGSAVAGITALGDDAAALVYWVTGAEAACEVSKTNENKKYDGELAIDTAYTQMELSEGVGAGKFMFHKVGDDVRVLMDINSLTTYTDEKGEDFGNNQTVRVLDQIGNDVASLFNTRYLGIVPNDDSGRVALWNDIVSYNKELVKLRAIEEFDTKNITVAAGDSKRSVVVNCPVTPINCMSQLYMTIVVS